MMKKILQLPIEKIMSSPLTKVTPDTILTEIAKLFDTYDYHHLPVVDAENNFVGMVSKSDYYKLQHHFTILKTGSYKEENERLFSSLIASDIMHKHLHVVQVDDRLEVALDLFLRNRFHSVVAIKDGKCVGIVTPYDILKKIKSID
jgi:acetoin utilization protein AcuB